MSYEGVTSGAVIQYPYLWSREAARGETEGRKRRASAVAIRVARLGLPDLVILFPITTQQPQAGRLAAEVPAAEKKRAGLDSLIRQWLVLDECNEELIPGTHYLTPDPPIGRFSKGFFLPLMREFIKRCGSVKKIGRRDLTLR